MRISGGEVAFFCCVVPLSFSAPRLRLTCAESGSDGQPSGEFKKFLEREESPTLDELIASLESTDDFEIKFLSSLSGNAGLPMCDCAHTGGRHIGRWLTDVGIESNYARDEILEVMQGAATIASLSIATSLALLANDVICKDELLRCLKVEKVNTRPRRLLINSHMPRCCHFSADRKEPSCSVNLDRDRIWLLPRLLDNLANGFLR